MKKNCVRRFVFGLLSIGLLLGAGHPLFAQEQNDGQQESEDVAPSEPEAYEVSPISLPSPMGEGESANARDSTSRREMETKRVTEEGQVQPPEPYEVSPIELPDLTDEQSRSNSEEDGQ